MSREAVSKAYAQAIYKVAREQNKIDSVGAQLADFETVYNRYDGLRSILQCPRIKGENRKGVADEIAALLESDMLSRTVINLLIDKGRIGLLKDIYLQYKTIADRAAHRQVAHVKTAVALTDRQRDALKSTLERITGMNLTMHVERDEGLLAGIVAKVGDRLFDGSVRGELRLLRKELMEDTE
jgi:F-type H+-transporting ATPase subunit delta